MKKDNNKKKKEYKLTCISSFEYIVHARSEKKATSIRVSNTMGDYLRLLDVLMLQ